MKASLRFQVLLLLGLAVSAPEVAARAPVVADGSLSAVRDTLVIVRRGQSLSQVLITGQSLRIPLGPLALNPRPTQERDTTIGGETVRGIYINVRRSGEMGGIGMARRLKEAGGNAIVFDIKDRDGMLTYDSHVDFAVDVGATGDAVIVDLRVFVQRLHELGLHVIARLVCFQDVHLAASGPTWCRSRQQDRRGPNTGLRSGSIRPCQRFKVISSSSCRKRRRWEWTSFNSTTCVFRRSATAPCPATRSRRGLMSLPTSWSKRLPWPRLMEYRCRPMSSVLPLGRTRKTLNGPVRICNECCRTSTSSARCCTPLTFPLGLAR